ncbi:hypothetical protein AB0H58_29050 [Nocardia neocaledoniensis]|uniref:DUF732 domain-containing protein n=1 Tax=Nocardia neocaledoniensis TaxID=236511 RepID=A0A317NKZ0_9NOCA|nr:MULTISPECIES: hypothetical protein [Nocardia]PWV75999.1 hypothetical protein DFR69_104101 [Nocardia neocaledoniensis]UGT58347.1 hypothetical protein LTT85_16540 [Nocardia asteroides]GEM30634.1 hypothetical protein NN3_16410 [Nocardia neocaledoniensis NBRC 108232]
MRICLIAAALIAAPMLSACGGGDEAPAVTQAELSKSLQDKGLKNAELADCAAQVFLDSGMSQDGLRVMVSNGQSGDPAKLLGEDDAAKVSAAQSKIAADCVRLGS